MSKYFYISEADLEHVQKLPVHIEPHKREYFKIRPDGMSLAEIASEIGVSKQRVEQIINGALEKLRKRAESLYVDLD